MHGFELVSSEINFVGSLVTIWLVSIWGGGLFKVWFFCSVKEKKINGAVHSSYRLFV